MSSASNTTNKEQLEKELYDTTRNLVYNTYRKAVIFLIIFALFVINLYALSLSLHCNVGEPLTIRLASGLFAFMFGFFYVMVNYYFYRVKNPNATKGICNINAARPFGFMRDIGLTTRIVKNVRDTAQVFR